IPADEEREDAKQAQPEVTLGERLLRAKPQDAPARVDDARITRPERGRRVLGDYPGHRPAEFPTDSLSPEAGERVSARGNARLTSSRREGLPPAPSRRSTATSRSAGP